MNISTIPVNRIVIDLEVDALSIYLNLYSVPLSNTTENITTATRYIITHTVIGECINTK